LEVERGLTIAQVREALAQGALHEDDLIRPSGSSVPWVSLINLPELRAEELKPSARGRGPGKGEQIVSGEAAPPREAPHSDKTPLLPPKTPEPGPAAKADAGAARPAPDAPREEPLDALIDEGDSDVELDLSRLDLDAKRLDTDSRAPSSRVVLPVDDEEMGEWLAAKEEEEEEYDPQEEDEAAASFTLSRSAPERVEELDLAAMVDVAFQLVLFFLVTATTVLYKTLEVPTPNPESPPGAVNQGQGRTLDDLQRDYILVEIDTQGAVKVDHEAAPSDMRALAERLRTARQSTGRTAMLLSADAATMHRNAVTAYDAANEIGLRIAIARPSSGATAQAPAPPPPPAAKKAAEG
jgi:biopolymer transport protein ExbD